MKSRALVIGAGLGGISAALRLRARGFEVSLVDRLDQVGGRARVFKQEGFTFDAGPTVLTAPFLIDELFELFGKKSSDYLEYREVNPWYRFLFSDGRTFDYGYTVDHTLAEIEKFHPADKQGYLNLLRESEQIFNTGFLELGDEPFHKWTSMLKAVPSMIRLKAFRSVYALVSKHLKSDHLRRAFSIQPLLVGGNPFDTTCIYNLIHYLERKWAIHYVMGGTGALIRALETLMREAGINIVLGNEVKRLCGGARLRSAVLADGQELSADVFVCNGDPSFLYENLVPQEFNKKWTKRKIEKLKYSMGLFVLYFGSSKMYSDVQHHTIIMGDSYQELLKTIFDKKKLCLEDMSLYLHRPTATDSTMAPEGHDCFYVLSPVPNLQSDTNWSEMATRYKNLVYQKLESSCLPNIRQHIVTERLMTPKSFEADYLTKFGTGFTIAPQFNQSAYFRYHNKSEDFENLYLVGAGTHPGAGMPGVLCSSKVLDKLAL